MEPTRYLIAADAQWVRDLVRSTFVGRDDEVIAVDRGQDVRDTVRDTEPDLVILDLQIGNMGGVAAALDLRLEEGAQRLPHVPILMLLDREADRFLAGRASVEGAIVKPIDPGALRRAAKAALAVSVGS